MAAKKKAKKQAPEENSEAYPPAEFNLLDREDFVSNMMSSIEESERRKKRSSLVFDQSKVVRDVLEIDSLYFQWCIDNRGIEKKTLAEIIGRDGTGKSSLLYWLAGCWMKRQIPLVMNAGEDKLIKESWARMCLSTDEEMARKMVRTILVIRPRTLNEVDQKVKEQVRLMRDPESKTYVPKHIPVVIAIDLMNKIATQIQAAGMNTGFGDFSKEDEADLGDRGHNWDRAKAYHDLINRFNLLIPDNNLVFLVSTHQNDQAAGGGKVNPFTPEWHNGLANRTKPGGQATNQSVALQLILYEKGLIYCEKEVIAKRVVMKPFKNSYGGDRRTCTFALVPGDDATATPRPGLRWDLTTAEWFAEMGFFGMKRLASSPATAPLYSCSDLGLSGATIIEAAAAIRSLPQTDIETLGRKLKIPGYMDPIREAVDELKKGEPTA